MTDESDRVRDRALQKRGDVEVASPPAKRALLAVIYWQIVTEKYVKSYETPIDATLSWSLAREAPSLCHLIELFGSVVLYSEIELLLQRKDELHSV